MDRILLFIPAYNCEKQIVRVLDQLDDHLLNYITETIVINNRSTDNTEAVVKSYSDKNKHKNIKILRNRQNYNLGGSHKVAFQYAIDNQFDYVIILHGDDQGNLNDFSAVLSNHIYKEHDCVLGARFKKGAKLVGYSKFRTFGNLVYNSIFSMALNKNITDLGSGLNMYHVDMLKNEFYIKFPDQLTFNYCMIMAANFYKHKIYFSPISWREEDQVSNVKMTSQAINVLAMLFKYLTGKKKFITSDLRQEAFETYDYDDVTTERI